MRKLCNSLPNPTITIETKCQLKSFRLHTSLPHTSLSRHGKLFLQKWAQAFKKAFLIPTWSIFPTSGTRVYVFTTWKKKKAFALGKAEWVNPRRWCSHSPSMRISVGNWTWRVRCVTMQIYSGLTISFVKKKVLIESKWDSSHQLSQPWSTTLFWSVFWGMYCCILIISLIVLSLP